MAAGLEEAAAGLLGGAAAPVLLLRPAVPFTALAGDLQSSMPYHQPCQPAACCRACANKQYAILTLLVKSQKQSKVLSRCGQCTKLTKRQQDRTEQLKT